MSEAHERTWNVPPYIDCYSVDTFVAGGAFGEVWRGTDTRNNVEVAIKFESDTIRPPQLALEVAFYTRIHAHGREVGFPIALAHGNIDGYNYLVMTLMGPSLDDLRNLDTSPGQRFSESTCLSLSVQAIRLLEMVHDSGFLHRDLKPSNMMMGVGAYREVLHLIDFGMAKELFDARDVHIPMQTTKKIIGTIPFMSLNIHNAWEQGRRDDLESLAYVMILLSKGSLPWEFKDHATTRSMKESIPLEELCSGAPGVFIKWVRYVRDLEFTERPNYKALRKMMMDYAKKKNIDIGTDYDWVSS